ncbi:hypothetical protein O3M35_013086 [Rhynocoris fuscipes]|uniref:Small integral membrane protein 12 n=1 Tax=Rhynocoris fuscipes TaxID=488301 RepID=A0AAW1CF52_9HEMI
MFPLIFRAVRVYAPYITLPAAALIGIIGYNVENWLSDKYTPYQESIKEKRTERLLENGTSNDGSLKEKKFISDTVFDKNLSPSLQDKN